MPHQHLRLERLDGVERNANHDDDGRAADGQRAVANDDADDDRQDRNDCQIQGAKERDLVDDLQNEIGGRLARTEAGDEAAVLLQVVCNFNRVELHGRVEVAERDDEQEIANDIHGALRVEDVLVHPSPERRTC